MNRWMFFAPLALFGVMAVYFAIGLTKDPKILPSALIDKPVPEFNLPAIAGGRGNGFSSADLKGRVSVVNVFASWCGPCRFEHPIINKLAAMKIAPVYGLNQKDAAADALAWLFQLGDSYTAVGADTTGRVSIDWGVYGVPETFIIDDGGRIRYKHVGPVTEKALNTVIIPTIKDLSK